MSKPTKQTSSHNKPFVNYPSANIPDAPTLTFMGQKVTPDGDFDFKNYVNAVYNPAEKVLTQTYNRQLGQSAGSANALGTLDSLGFQNYRTNQLDKNYSSQKSDLYNQAQLSAQDYVNNLLNQDFQNRYNNSNMLNNYVMNAINAQNSYNSGDTTTKTKVPLWGIF